jgi:isoquinoline 1-oxidoreductase beta subunit
MPNDPKSPSAIELGMGYVDLPFAIPNIRIESADAQSHLRVGWFRSVNNIAHAFSVQSFVAEIAHELGRDQKDSCWRSSGRLASSIRANR